MAHTFTFRLPDIGEGIAAAEIVQWHVAVGDTIGEDSPLVDMLTDKATVEIETPVAGKVIEIAGAPGAQIAIGATLAVIEVEAEAGDAGTDDAAEPAATHAEIPGAPEAAGETPAATPPDAVAPPDAAAPARSGAGATEPPGPTASPAPTGASNPVSAGSAAPIAARPAAPGTATPAGATTPAATGTAPPAAALPTTPTPTPAHPAPGEAPATAPHPKILATPAVRARAKSLGVDLAQVHAAGDHIRHADLDAFLRYGSAQGYRAPDATQTRADEAIPVIGLRRRIAENMAAAKRHIPHFTYVEEIEVTALEAMRADLNTASNGQAGTGSAGQTSARPKLTLLPFLITALTRTLPAFPMLNARYDDEANVVTRHGAVHLGIATQTPQGLMVPVIRDAHSLNIWQLAAEIARLSAAARAGTAKREEISGSTITITSLGPLGGIATAPVINRPEVAIIGPNRIIERPVFADATGERLRRAKLMNLSIACDHRVVDGWDAASFVAAVKRMLEAPALLLAP